MDENKKCPVCLEVPGQQIFQCTNRHIICGTCCAELELCPICREPYGTTKIRNRTLEQILDRQKFNCCNIDRGCKMKLKRQDILQHADICSHNPIDLCKSLGYDDCKFILNSSEPMSTMKHFQEKHGIFVERTNKICLWHKDFKSTIEATTSKKWSPILLSLDAEWCGYSVFMVVGCVDVQRKYASWNCLQICGSSTSNTLDTLYEVEFALLNSKTNTPLLKWTLPIHNVQQNSLENGMESSPIQIPLSFLKKLSNEMSDVPISIAIECSNRASKSSGNSRIMWTYSSEMKLTQKKQNSGIICPNINCDGCQTRCFPGIQYKCLQCPDYDLCEGCMSSGTHAYHIFVIVTTIEQRQMIRFSFDRMRIRSPESPDPLTPEFQRNESSSSSTDIICPNVSCDGCGAEPIVGKQYKCCQCFNYDLCQNCLESGIHSSHMFIMIASFEQRQLIRRNFEQIRY